MGSELNVTKSLEVVARAIQAIQQKRSSELSFEELYRTVYAIVSGKQSDKLYSLITDTVKRHLTSQVYANVEQALTSKFIKNLIEQYDQYVMSLERIKDICMYLERIHSDPNKLRSIRSIGTTLFMNTVMTKRVLEHLRNELIVAIGEERNGMKIEWLEVKKTCDMLITLGGAEFYEKQFENPFIFHSIEYYQQISQEFLSQNNAAQYIIKVDNCLNMESERAKRCMRGSTETRIVEVCVNTLIIPHLSTVLDMDSGVKYMMENDKVDDLRRLYNLLRRVRTSTDLVADAASSYIRSKGAQLMEEAGTELTKNPSKFIEDILALKTRAHHYLKEAFSSDKLFEEKMESDFEYVMNKEKKSAEYLSSYVDEQLRKGAKNADEAAFEKMLDDATMLFRYIGDKDIFERYYKRDLSKRLLLDKISSEETEKAVLARLRIESGMHFTQKIDGMFKDRHLWENLNGEFREFVKQEASSVDVSVRVLTTGIWPTQYSASCVLPDNCTTAFLKFEQFYNLKYSGRKLTPNTMLGQADVKATFYGNKVEHKILTVSTHMMVVLMRFNVREKNTYQQLLDETHIPEGDLRRVIQSLAMAKSAQRILVRKGQEKTIELSDVFHVNDAFTSKLNRVKVVMVTTNRGEADNERKDTNKKIDDDRKHEIAAAIVRIMKARKSIMHVNLITEVTQQLSARFMPNPLMIKERIENLIDREYLSRDPVDQKHYLYVA